MLKIADQVALATRSVASTEEAAADRFARPSAALAADSPTQNSFDRSPGSYSTPAAPARRGRWASSPIFFFALWLGALLLGSPAGASMAQVAGAGGPVGQPPRSGDLISSKPFEAPAAIKADARLLIHYMPSVVGGMTRASTLLFVPKKTPPAGGWLIVAWSHGTMTAGQKLVAPSLSPTLDGDLTKGGFISHYVFVIQSLVDAGYAVVAPDMEGLGAVATVPEPYFNLTSMARSLLAGVQAAHQANAHLSTRWAAVGHSDGAHGVLGVEAVAAEAPELTLQGTVAYAPYTSLAATVTLLGKMATRTPGKALDYLAEQNFNVALMAVGIQAQDPAYDPSPVMGADLRQLIPVFKTKGSVEIINTVTQAIRAKTPAAFAGFTPQWSTTPEMRTFLTTNDPAVMPGFTLRVPTLVVQGMTDVFVPEPLDAAFTARLIAAGAPVTYHTYPGKDHFAVIPAATSEVLAFLAQRFRQPKSSSTGLGKSSQPTH